MCLIIPPAVAGGIVNAAFLWAFLFLCLIISGLTARDNIDDFSLGGASFFALNYPWPVGADEINIPPLPREGYKSFFLPLIRHGFAAPPSAVHTPVCALGRPQGEGLRDCPAPPVSLRVGRSTGLTRHRRVIQHRGPLEGKANEGAPPRGRLGDVFIVLYTVGRKVV